MDAVNYALSKKMSWNDLKDKPFYDGIIEYVKWDGNIEGLISVDIGGMLVYKISDLNGINRDNITSTNLSINATYGSNTVSDVYGVNLNTSSFFDNYALVIYGDESDFPIIVIFKENSEALGVTFPETGVYTFDVLGMSEFDQLSMIIYKKDIMPIDEKFIPNTYIKSINDITPSPNGNVNVNTFFVITEISDGVVDKTDEEINTALLNGNQIILIKRNINTTAGVFYMYKHDALTAKNLFFSSYISSDTYHNVFTYATVSNGTVIYESRDVQDELDSLNEIIIQKADKNMLAAQYTNKSKTGGGVVIGGYLCKSKYQGAVAEGCNTIAATVYEHVQGKYNIPTEVTGSVEDVGYTGKYAHVVGNGTSDTDRSNAHTLDWDGNGWYAGKLSQEGTPTDDKDVATKKYVDDSIVAIPPSVMTVTITANDDGTYSADKTFEEISEAYKSGRVVQCVAGEIVIPLCEYYENAGFLFYLISITTGTIFGVIIDAGNGVQYTEESLCFQGSTSTTAGFPGLVPEPSKGDQDKFLKGDGTWSDLPLSFNDAGELEVTLNGVTKTFVPK